MFTPDPATNRAEIVTPEQKLILDNKTRFG